ncbi:PLP-dependent aminotransferase family protein [Bermanella sp. WJH001]|uniref:aminotransferase-like domain-containing protein n=1 Tax=Bermanella sp. WJH001 TaxID=3048005 RepID=UPI0024BE6E13|nr:PLP-dependent aminotransferase family protein [Bermanella sp. WJH001]MDJ1536858.1 PLP-dependent aminotransferase family protein [Bermanella sp. WJH001]
MTTLYQKVANDIALDINQGVYLAGQKVPSVRTLAKIKTVSISTITQAYALLEDQGYLTARPQSGYYVKDGANDPIEPPPVSRGSEPTEFTKSDLISMMLNAVHQDSLVNFGAAIAHESFMPQHTLQTHINKTARFQSKLVFNYLFSPGLESLRRQIATRMRSIGVKCHPNEIVITQGCSEALSLCLKSCTKAGDIIAVESPCYYGFLQLAGLLGLQVIEIPTDAQEGISLDALTLALKQWPIKLIAVSARFSNPTGSAISSSKQKQLYELAKKHDVSILEDDIYGELGFNESINSVIKTFDTDGRVMHCSSFSKTVSPGLRVGWCIAGKQHENIITAQTYSSFSPSSLSQYTLSSYLESGHYDRHLRKTRSIYQQNIEAISQLVKQFFPSRTRISQPKGGFIIWIALPEHTDVMALQKDALKVGINIAPGAMFSNTNEFDHYIRLNCAIPIDANVSQGIKTLGKLAGAQME